MFAQILGRLALEHVAVIIVLERALQELSENPTCETTEASGVQRLGLYCANRVLLAT